jgi:RNA methyltransferase, TrmH family
MISKNNAKYLKSLQIKKYRNIEHRFLVEGWKNVEELLISDFEVEKIFGTKAFLEKNIALIKSKNIECIEATDAELIAVGSYQSNDGSIALVKMKDWFFQPSELQGKWTLALDEIRDPGNLGTIIRIADWYGIDTILASQGTTDLYNPKVISATMGSFTRVKVVYFPDSEFLEGISTKIYGAFLEGENLHKKPILAKEGILLMGNESNGIRKEIEDRVDFKVSIPRFGQAESLNVAIATAVICDNIRRG